MICPASISRTLDFLADRGVNGSELSRRHLVQREGHIRQLRRSGHLAEAERYGWASLAGLLVGVKSAAVCDPPMTRTYVSPLGSLEPPIVESRFIAGTEIVVDVAMDPDGEWLVACAAAQTSTVEVEGSHIATDAVVAGIADAVRHWSRGKADHVR